MERTGRNEQIQARLGQARLQLRAGATMAALDSLEQLDRQFPQQPDVMRMRGLILARIGRDHDAEQIFRELVNLRPDDRSAASDHANMLLKRGLADEALAALKPFEDTAKADHRTQSADPATLALLFNLGRAYKLCGQAEQAVGPLQQLVDSSPDHYGALLTLGDTLKALGNISAAATVYRQAIAAQPDIGTGWWSLSNLKADRFSDQEFDQLRRAAEQAVEGEQKVFFEFALAAAFEQRDQFDQAFACYQSGNRHKRAMSPWNRNGFGQWLKTLEGAMKQVSVSQKLPRPEHPRPVFIVSLPRSGSTLTEQILGAHSQVTAAGELPWLPQVIAAESSKQNSGVADWAARQTPAGWERLGAAYLEKCSHWLRHSRVFTDKLPGNVPYAGPALAMLPNALVIHVKRQAMDVCWSCYRQLFISGSEFAYDFGDLAAYWHAASRHLEVIGRLAPARVLEISYEKLVTDPENQTRRLLEFVGLDFEESCLRPQHARRAVNTASAAQVRQPIHTGGVGHWKKFERHLAPLEEALSAFAAK